MFLQVFVSWKDISWILLSQHIITGANQWLGGLGFIRSIIFKHSCGPYFSFMLCWGRYISSIWFHKTSCGSLILNSYKLQDPIETEKSFTRRILSIVVRFIFAFVCPLTFNILVFLIRQFHKFGLIDHWKILLLFMQINSSPFSPKVSPIPICKILSYSNLIVDQRIQLQSMSWNSFSLQFQLLIFMNLNIQVEIHALIHLLDFSITFYQFCA